MTRRRQETFQTGRGRSLAIGRSTLAALALAALAACGGEQAAVPEAPAAEIESPAAPSGERTVRMSASAARAAHVEVGPAEQADVPDMVEVAGRVTLDEDRTARVGSFAEGVVIDCCKSVGSYVRKGDILAKVHSHATHEIVAEYLTAKAELRGRESELAYARQAHERARKLLELKAGALQTAQAAETAVHSAETAVAAAEAAVQRSIAHLDFYGLDPAKFDDPENAEEPHIDIHAPASGAIVERSVKLGDVVTPSTEMYVLSDLSRVWVIAQVPEERLALMRPGMHFCDFV